MSILQTAIKQIEASRRAHPNSGYYNQGKRDGMSQVISILRSLLPAEQEERKEVARKAYMLDKHPYEPMRGMYEKQFDTWYNQLNDKK